MQSMCEKDSWRELPHSAGSSARHSVMTWRDAVGEAGREEHMNILHICQEAEHICVHIADSQCCTADSDTIL